MLLVGTPLVISLANSCFKSRRQLPSILAYLFKDICFIKQAWKAQCFPSEQRAYKATHRLFQSYGFSS